MSRDDQSTTNLREAKLTLRAAEAIYESAIETDDALWAGVVKNGYDAIEQAISAAIAARGESIPRTHPGKIERFVELYEPEETLESLLLHWLRRRSDSQYVDIRGEELNVPHRKFNVDDANEILDDAERIVAFVGEEM